MLIKYLYFLFSWSLFCDFSETKLFKNKIRKVTLISLKRNLLVFSIVAAFLMNTNPVNADNPDNLANS